jgi:hypothetical protein
MGKRIKLGMVHVFTEQGQRARIASEANAMLLVGQGKAVLYYRDGVCRGIKLCSAKRIAAAERAAHEAAKRAAIAAEVRERLRSSPDARRSCVVLSRAEAEAVADRSRSRTAALTDEARDARVAMGLPEMDLPERARRKFHAMFGEGNTEPSFA